MRHLILLLILLALTAFSLKGQTVGNSPEDRIKDFTNIPKETSSLIDSLDRISVPDSTTLSAYIEVIQQIYQSAPGLAEILAGTTLIKAKKLGLLRTQFDCHFFLIFINLEFTQYAKAQQAIIACKEILKKEDFQGYEARLDNAQGLFFYAQGIYEEASIYIRRSLEYWKQEGEHRRIAIALNNLGTIYLEKQEYDSALANFSSALEYKRLIGNQQSTATTLGNIGSAYSSAGKYELALETMLEADSIYQIFDNNSNMSLSKRLIARILINLERTDEALPYLQEAERISGQIRNPKMLYLTYEEYARYHFAREEYRMAYLYKDKYALLKDSVYNNESANAIMELRTNYEDQQRENELMLSNQKLELLNLQQEKTQTVIVLLALVVLSILLVAFIFFRLQRTKLEKNQVVAAREREIQEAKMGQLQEELAARARELTSRALEMVKKNDFLNQLKADLVAVPTVDPVIKKELSRIN